MRLRCQNSVRVSSPMLVAAAMAVSVGAFVEPGRVASAGQRPLGLTGAPGRALAAREQATGWLSCLTTAARRLSCPTLSINFNPSQARPDGLEPSSPRPILSDVCLLPTALERVGSHHIDLPPPATVHG